MMRKGWYILVGVTVALIVVLIGFATYMTSHSHQANCASGAVSCNAAPPRSQ